MFFATTEISITLRDLAYYAIILTGIVTVVIETRIRVFSLGRSIEGMKNQINSIIESHNECARFQTERYEDIRDLLAEMKKELALSNQRLDFIVAQMNGKTGNKKS